MAIPATTEVPLSGEPFIDGLLSGGRWHSGGGSLTLTWGTANNPFQGYFWTDPAALAGDIKPIVQQWANVANINFSYSGHFSNFATAPVDIAVSISDGTILADALAVGISPLKAFGDDLLAALGWTRADWAQPEGDIFANINAADGSAEHTTYVAHHELGHALGLKHPHDGGAVDNPTFSELGLGVLDSTLYTVMSYNVFDGFGFPIYAATPMPLDILAVQHLYGANLSHRTGNDTYVLGETGYMQTIWDAGGWDTFDASTAPVGVYLDLYDFDGFNGYSVHGLSSITAIAAGVTIEAAIGSPFADTLLGNEAANRIWGGGGDDSIFGDRGGDRLSGGAGDDFIEGYDGRDLLLGATGADTLYGQNGVDRLVGGGGNDWLIGGTSGDTVGGGAGHDTIYGQHGDDTLLGNTGNDYANGSIGQDVLVGGAGNDRMIGGPGGDRMLGGAHHDWLEGGDDGDYLNGGAGSDVLLGGNANDRLIGGTGTDLLDGGFSNDVIGGTGNDKLIGGGGADRFIFADTGSDPNNPERDFILD